MNVMHLKERNMSAGLYSVIYGGFRKPTLAVMMQEGWCSSGNRSRCFPRLVPAAVSVLSSPSRRLYADVRSCCVIFTGAAVNLRATHRSVSWASGHEPHLANTCPCSRLLILCATVSERASACLSARLSSFTRGSVLISQPTLKAVLLR